MHRNNGRGSSVWLERNTIVRTSQRHSKFRRQRGQFNGSGGFDEGAVGGNQEWHED